jgi:hypothetical protein
MLFIPSPLFNIRISSFETTKTVDFLELSSRY